MRHDGFRAPNIAQDRQEIVEGRREFPAVGLGRGSGGYKTLRHVPPPLQFGRAQRTRDLLKQLVFEETAYEFGPRIIFPLHVAPPRQQELCLDVDQRRGQLQELPRAVELQTLDAVGEHILELPGDGRNRDIEDVDVLRPNEVQKQIQGSLKAVELHDERLRRPLARKSVGNGRQGTSRARAGGNRRSPAKSTQYSSPWQSPAAFERRCISPETLRSASLLGQMARLCSHVAPCQASASPLSALTRGFSTGCRLRVGRIRQVWYVVPQIVDGGRVGLRPAAAAAGLKAKTSKRTRRNRMPNNESQKKRLRQSQARRLRNRRVRSEIRTRTRHLLTTESPEQAAPALSELYRVLDRATRRNVIKANAAARRKARAARHVNGLG